MDTRDGLWNNPGEHTRVRSQECSLGYAPGDNMSGWRPRLIQAMSLAMPLGRFLGICAGYNHQCAPVPLGVYALPKYRVYRSIARLKTGLPCAVIV